MVGGAQRLQADVCQLQLLLPQLVLQLEDNLGLGFGAFAQPATRITHREEEGVTSRVISHTHNLERKLHTWRKQESLSSEGS